jgi:hypothetical protein
MLWKGGKGKGRQPAHGEAEGAMFSGRPPFARHSWSLAPVQNGFSSAPMR